MILNNKQLQSLHDSIDGMTAEGARTLGCMMDMGRPALTDEDFGKSLKEEIGIEIFARDKMRQIFGDPRWGR
jgi:hypothetical protein